jgi:hypothetical protein
MSKMLHDQGKLQLGQMHNRPGLVPALCFSSCVVSCRVLSSRVVCCLVVSCVVLSAELYNGLYGRYGRRTTYTIHHIQPIFDVQLIKRLKHHPLFDHDLPVWNLGLRFRVRVKAGVRVGVKGEVEDEGEGKVPYELFETATPVLRPHHHPDSSTDQAKKYGFSWC